MALGGHDWTTVDQLLTKAIGIESKQKKSHGRSDNRNSGQAREGEGKEPKNIS